MWADLNIHLDEAKEMIQRALQIEPNNGSYLDSLGWVEFRQGEFDQALADLLRAAKNLDREDPIVFEHIGDTYLKLHRVPEALESWQKAFALDPKNKKLAEKIESTKTTISSGSSAKTNSTTVITTNIERRTRLRSPRRPTARQASNAKREGPKTIRRSMLEVRLLACETFPSWTFRT